MGISTADFPQADVLRTVGEVAIAVQQGNHADGDIEKFIGLSSQGRQGRYYRLAAEILGLITNADNNAALTALGTEFATLTSAGARRDFLARCLLETKVFGEALKYIHVNRPSEEQLRAWFGRIYPGRPSTAARRYSTFSNYLRDAQLVDAKRGQYVVRKFTGAVVKERRAAAAGLTLAGGHSPKAAEPVVGAAATIGYEVDSQKRERAIHTHWKLVAAKAAFLDARGFPSHENEVIDLYSFADEDPIIYEMKSTSIGGANLPAQVRKAVAQLYEYRFVFNAPKARLCIVTDLNFGKRDMWLVDYLARDRGIAYEWTEDFEEFTCHEPSRALLGRYSP